MTHHYDEDDNGLQPGGDENVERSVEKAPAASGTHAVARENSASEPDDRFSVNTETHGSSKTVRNHHETGGEVPAPADDGGSEKHGAADEASADRSSEETLGSLEAKGFTHEEAERLLRVSDQLAGSGESIEAEATLRRLRFTKWLVEQGLLNDSAPQE